MAFFLWLALPGIHGTQPTSLTYSQFQSDVLAHKVKTVSVPQTSGASTGTLTNGTSYTVNLALSPPGQALAG